jgi:hypothetical protein
MKNASTCPVRCPDTRPFPCRTDTCFVNPNLCTPTCQNVTCWNGRCVENSMSCDPVIACPDTFPFRCVDGSCAFNASSCSDSTCPFSQVRCPDTGICVTSLLQCVSYNGCPVNQYQVIIFTVTIIHFIVC